MISGRIPLADVVSLCRTLRHSLDAGVSLVRVLEQQSQRGPRAARPLAGRLLDAVKQGDSFSAALERERGLLPGLLVDMAALGDQTGHLPEIFGELERYFQMQVQLRRQFRSQTFLPVLQFLLGVFVVAGVILVVGALTPPGGRPLLTFFGLGGAPGALAFLGLVFGGIAALVFAYVVGSRALKQQAAVDRVLLGLPVIGPCLQALALGRLALALQLTLDSGLSVTKALRLSLNAAGNAAFAEASDRVVQALKEGQTLYEAMLAGPFPEEFLHVLASAEEGGRVPEAMKQQAAHYHEEASRLMKAVTTLATTGVYGMYAAFMIWAIFKLAGAYLAQLGA